MRIFTACAGDVVPYAQIEEYVLKGAGLKIPAIIIGEAGRGRQLGVLPVYGASPGDHVEFGRLEQTSSGRPKLVVLPAPEGPDALVVLRTPIGFRGGNSHTGDRSGWYCSGKIDWERTPCLDGVQTPKPLPAPERCPECGAEVNITYHPFPGRIILEGMIAQGAAGRMGCGKQLVAVIQPGTIFRTHYSGRLYGRPSAHYYFYDGEKLLSATWEERQLADIW